MKILKVACTGVLISALMTGCAEEAAPPETKKVQNENPTEEVQSENPTEEVQSENPAEEVQSENPTEEINEAKAWKDVSKPDGFNNIYGIEPTLNAWIAFHAEDFAKSADAKEYLQKATQISLESNRYFRVRGEDIEKDFENLQALATTINHYSYVISEQVNREAEKTESQEQLNIAIEDFTELLHDLNIAINKDEKGEPFGVTHQLDGSKVEELESFIY